MKLDFGYDGKTRLKKWWTQVRENFLTIQTEHNDLDAVVAEEKEKLKTETTQRSNANMALSNRINSEANTRFNADTALGNRIDAEASSRQAADTALQQKINSETSARSSADNTLDKKITDAAAESKNADNALSERVMAVEGKAHTHINAEVLDGISESDIEHWNGILEQVTQTQLDAAIAYFEEIGFSLTAQLAMLMNALGVTVYDGGYFNQAQTDAALDGGAFQDTDLTLFDCGGFEPITVSAAVIDGGSY